jgi:ferrous iron transport protein A
MKRDDRIVPLGLLRPGETGIIVDLSGGRGFVARCLVLGCTPGTQVTMERNAGRGPIIVKLRGTRLALGRGESMRLQVKRQGN